jgi:hypothetical protein
MSENQPKAVEGNVEKRLSRDEKLRAALATVRESVVGRLGVASMEEARQRPLLLAAELDLMIRDFHSRDTNGENYYFIEATSEILRILESAMEYERDRQRYPEAAAALS